MIAGPLVRLIDVCLGGEPTVQCCFVDDQVPLRKFTHRVQEIGDTLSGCKASLVIVYGRLFEQGDENRLGEVKR